MSKLLVSLRPPPVYHFFPFQFPCTRIIPRHILSNSACGFEAPISKIIWYVFFGDLLFSCIIILLRLIHTEICSYSSLICPAVLWFYFIHILNVLIYSIEDGPYWLFPTSLF